MKRGPKGAEIETQREETVTRTWKFSGGVLTKRLGLPEATEFTADYGDGNQPFSLKAVASEVRKPKVTT